MSFLVRYTDFERTLVIRELSSNSLASRFAKRGEQILKTFTEQQQIYFLAPVVASQK